MKIVYFHGFGSSGASGTVEILRRILPDDEIIAPDMFIRFIGDKKVRDY
jgi:hypothetical protein